MINTVILLVCPPILLFFAVVTFQRLRRERP